MKSWKQINPKYIFGFKLRVVWNLKPGCITDTATHAFLLRSGPCSRCHGKVLSSKQPATSYTHSEMLPTMSWDGKWPSVGIACVNASCMLFEILFTSLDKYFAALRTNTEWLMWMNLQNMSQPKLPKNHSQQTPGLPALDWKRQSWSTLHLEASLDAQGAKHNEALSECFEFSAKGNRGYALEKQHNHEWHSVGNYLCTFEHVLIILQ